VPSHTTSSRLRSQRHNQPHPTSAPNLNQLLPLTRALLGISVLSIGAINLAWSDDTATDLGTVAAHQTDTQSSSPTTIDWSKATTNYQVNMQDDNAPGTNGGTNPYWTIANLPSVSLDTVDSYGLANMPAGQKGLRIRGEMMPHGAIGTIDGLPLMGIDPGPGTLMSFDNEDLSAISVQEGPVAPDNISLFTNVGVVDSQVLWPMQHSHALISQSIGAFGFDRTFVRLDSGTLPDGSAFMLSASNTGASKWRGPGDAPGGRKNIEFAWTHPLGDRADVKLYFTSDNLQEDSYRPLTYSQATNLGQFNYYDYSSTRSAGINYYGYNTQSFRDWSAFAELTYRMGEQSSLVFKPYYSQETGEYMIGGGLNTPIYKNDVLQWLIDHNTYGFSAEWRTQFASTHFKLGYAWDSMDPPGPPTEQKVYTPTTNGLSNPQWALLSSITQRNTFSNLYAMADQNLGAWHIQAGMRYVDETLPSINVYNPAGVGDVSYQSALASSSGINSKLSATGASFGTWLPFVSAVLPLDPFSEFRVSLGRNYGAPSFDIWPTYQNNSKLQGKYTAQQIWNSIRPETDDAIDAGWRIGNAKGFIEPTVFYSQNHNVEVGVTDPSISTTYQQNIGQTQLYGMQLLADYQLTPTWNGYASISWNKNTFTQNIVTIGGTPMSVEGLQVPDTPQWIANLGATWKQGPFAIMPMLHYTGLRYADLQHTQPVPSYSTTDINVSWEHKTTTGTLQALFSVTNVFNKQYIAFINTSSYTQAANGGPAFYPGAPQTWMAKLAYHW